MLFRISGLNRLLCRFPMLGAVAFVLSCASSVAHAEMRPSLNFYGATGLIDMPSGEMQPDGQLSVSSSYFGPISRTTLTFQIMPRISGSFRFLGIRHWNRNSACQPNCGDGDGLEQFKTYYDRSFDLRFKAFEEGRYMPSVIVGLQDFAGTGILSGEYIVATKTLTPTLKVTGGLGWGRLGSHNDIGSTFGSRKKIDVGQGGKINYKQWFHGKVAPFAGIEWQPFDDWTFKAEYSSDDYTLESKDRGTFDKKSPFNFGVEYQNSDFYRVGAYYMYGDEVGVAGHIFLNPKKRFGGFTERAPGPVEPRPSRAADPDAYDGGWVTQAGAGDILRDNIARRVKDDGIQIEALGFTAKHAQVRIRNTRYEVGAEAIGRTARVMSQILPASVEVFEIVPMVEGVPSSSVIIRRSDLEQLEFSPDAITKMRDRTQIVSASAPLPDTSYDPDLYPHFKWSLGPYTRFRFFDQKDPFKMDVGVRAIASYEIAPGLTIDGQVSQRVAGNLRNRPPLPERKKLQPVRSASYFYDREGTTSMDRLALTWTAKLTPDIYTRVNVGYLERMFGGVSSEVLWKPADSRLAFGAELNYVKQRAPNGKFGFHLPRGLYRTDNYNGGGPSSYDVVTGHVAVYYQFENGFNVSLDAGRYLAKDYGATLNIDREFANGWRVGAFATKTDVSSSDFGSGSFDKGIMVEIPLSWTLGSPSRRTSKTILRPFRRDGGAKLEMGERLYDRVRDYHASKLDSQFGRFWK